MVEHKKQLDKEALMNALRLKIARAFGTKNDCFQKMRLYFSRKVGSGLPFLNRHVIEEHIDELFFLYLPKEEEVGIAENHERVFKMLYELLTKGQDLIINRKATKQFEDVEGGSQEEPSFSPDVSVSAMLHESDFSPV